MSTRTVSIAAIALAASALTLVTFAADTSTSIGVSVTDLKFFDTGIGPIKAAAGFGDINKGAHASFTKLPAGFVSPLHRHTEDYYGVVISGVVANEPNASAKERPLPPGSYWFQKGNVDHVTKCLSANECVTFISQRGKFDFVETH